MIDLKKNRNKIIDEMKYAMDIGFRTINIKCNTNTKNVSSMYIVGRRSSTIANIRDNHSAKIKLGFSSKNEPWERFKAYLSEAQEEAMYLLYHIRIPYTPIPADKAIINLLKKWGYEGAKKNEERKSIVKISTEFIEDCPAEIMLKAIHAFYELDEPSQIDLARDKTFPMFDYQQHAHDKCVTLLKNAKPGDIIQYISPTRSGKSFTTANIIKTLFCEV